MRGLLPKKRRNELWIPLHEVMLILCGIVCNAAKKAVPPGIEPGIFTFAIVAPEGNIRQSNALSIRPRDM